MPFYLDYDPYAGDVQQVLRDGTTDGKCRQCKLRWITQAQRDFSWCGR